MATKENQDHYVFDSTLNGQREDYITNQLVAFNLAHSTALPSEQFEPLPLHYYALDQTETVVAGLIGRTHSIVYWLEISIIWVDERLRHQGLGRQLIEWAEREAARRRCHYARLATSNFQAPVFYQKLGYTLYGTLEHCPPGETCFYFWKKLDTISPDS